MIRFARERSLSLVFLGLFLAALVAQALVGHSDFNNEQLDHQDPAMSFGRYVTSSAFLVDVMENWQSEYLQFALFIAATQSDADQKVREHARADSPAWARAGGWRLFVYSNSLLAVMVAIWIGSWFAQLVTGRIVYNTEQFSHQEAGVNLWQYAGTSDFWDRTLQNWQSEFLAVASMVVFSIWLRQRGSPESKPVGEPHDSTGAEG
jgi:hypothetical protein